MYWDESFEKSYESRRCSTLRYFRIRPTVEDGGKDGVVYFEHDPLLLVFGARWILFDVVNLSIEVKTEDISRLRASGPESSETSSRSCVVQTDQAAVHAGESEEHEGSVDMFGVEDFV